MKSAVIIGGGPAGCQCALWLHMLGHDVVLIEQTHRLGGLQAMSPYPNNWVVGMLDLTGQEFACHIQRHIERLHIPVLFDCTVTEVANLSAGFSLRVNAEVIESHHIVIATGVSARREHFSASDTMLIGPGQHVYEYDFANKRVAILGGGDNAAENYAFIMRKKPHACHIYARTIRARKNLWKAVRPEDVYSSPAEIDEHTMMITHQNTQRKYDVMVVMYGWQANFPAALLAQKTNLLNDHGFILTDAQCRTPVANMYAIGEVTNRTYPCVTTAMADGVIAAKAIQEEVEKC